MNTHDIVVTAKYMAEISKDETVYNRICRLAQLSGFAAPKMEVKGDAVAARIDRSRWLADCECGGAEYVDPAHPVFFCCNCGNESNGGFLRPVDFPRDETRAALESLIISRPVTLRGGSTVPQRLMLAQESIEHLQRQWDAGESLLKIARENRRAGVQTMRAD
jgi:hypothetical protein